jgi:ankyrin repeat protein
MQDP